MTGRKSERVPCLNQTDLLTSGQAFAELVLLLRVVGIVEEQLSTVASSGTRSLQSLTRPTGQTFNSVSCLGSWTEA